MDYDESSAVFPVQIVNISCVNNIKAMWLAATKAQPEVKTDKDCLH